MQRNTRIEYFKEIAQKNKEIQGFSESMKEFQESLNNSAQHPSLVLEAEPEIKMINNGSDGFFFEEAIDTYVFVKPESNSYEHINLAWEKLRSIVEQIFSYIILKNALERAKGKEAVLLDFDNKIEPFKKMTSDGLVSYKLNFKHWESISLVYDPAKWEEGIGE